MAEKLSAFQQVNIDKALEVFDGNRYQLIVAAAQRAREIATKRLIADRAKPGQNQYENKPTVAALKEFADGQAGVEYLTRLANKKKV